MESNSNTPDKSSLDIAFEKFRNWLDEPLVDETPTAEPVTIRSHCVTNKVTSGEIYDDLKSMSSTLKRLENQRR
jgi:hypothetical protein